MNGQLFSSSGSANDTPTPPSNNSYPASLSSQSSRDASPSHGPRPGPNGANGPFQPLYRSSPYGQQISPNYPAQHSGYQQTDPKRPPWNDNNRPMTTAPHLASSMNQTTKLPSNPTSSATTPLAKVETTQVLSQNLGYNRPVINNRFPGSNFNVTPAPPSSNYGQMNAVSKSSEHLNSAPQFQSDSYLVNNQTLNNVSGYSDPMQNSSSRSSVTHDSPVLHQTTTSSASLNSSLGHLNSSPTPPPAKDHLQPYNDRELPTSSSSSPVQQVLHQNNSQNSSLYSTVQKMPGDGSSKATGRTEIHQQDDLFPVVGRQYNFHSSELNNDPESNSSVDNAEPSPAKIPAGELWPQNLHSTVAGGDFSEREDGNKPEVKPFVNHSNSHPSSVMQQASTTNPTISQSSSVERFTKPSAQNIQTFASNQSNPANVSPFSQANFYRPPNSTSNIPSSSHFPPTQEVNHISAVTGSQTNVAPNLTQDTGPGRYSPAVNTSRLPPLGATSASNIAPPTPTVNFGQTSASNLPPSTKYVPPTAAANFTPPPTSSTSFIPPPTSATNVSSSSSLIPSGLNSGRSTTNFAPPTSGSNFSPPPSSASNFAPQTSGSTAVHPQTTGPNFVPPKSGSNFAPTSAASFAPSSSSNFTPPTLGQNFANPNSGSNFAPQNSGSNFAPPKSAASFASPTSTANYAPPTSASNIASPPTSGSNFVPPPTSASNFAPLPTSGSNFAHPPTSASNIAPPPTSASNFAPPTSGSNFPNPASSASNFAPPPTSGSKFATPSSRFTPPPTAAPNFAPPSTSGSNFGPPASAAGFAPPTSAANNFAPPNFAPPPTSGSKFAPPSSRFTPPPTAAPNFAPPSTSGSNFGPPASAAGFAPPTSAANNFAPPNFAPPPTSGSKFAPPSSRFTPPPTAAPNFAPPSTSGSNFGPPASTAGFAPPRPAANNFAPPTSAAKFAPPSANYPPSSNYMPAATPRQQQFGGPPPVMSQPRPNMTPFQNQFQNRYPPSSAPGMQQQQNQFAPPNSYGPPPAAPYGNQQQANIAAGPYRQSPAQFQQMRPPQPGMMDSLTNQFRAASVTQEGYNRLWGMDTLDLLKTRDLLSKDKTEAPTIRLNPEMFDAPNCSPELFRCTLAKIPESKSLLEKSRLPLGVLIHPFKDLNQLSVIQCTTIVRCRTCRTYINPFVYFVDNKRWKCNLCFRVNELPEEFQFDPLTKTYGDPSRRPEIRSATIEFIAPSEYMVRPPQPAIYLFLLDVSRLGAECGYLSVVCQTLLDELDNLPGDARTSVGFITYDSSVHFYSLAEGLNRPHQMTVVDIDDMFLPSPDNLIVNLSENIDLVRDLLTNLPTQYAESYDTESALGAALQAAYKLLAPTGGRVTVFQARLPSIGPGALTAREDPSQRAGDSVPHLNPSTDFYKKLALDCSGQQVAVDIFFVNSQYVDIATLSGVSRFSGGCMHHFPLFRAVDLMHVKILKKCLRRYLSRKIGFESVMRLRCTRGLSVHTFHGNFFVRSTDLLSLPNVNPDAGFGMQVSIDENLSELQTVCFQAALLYTSSKGERRIRVHTLCLPIANSLSDVLNSADQLCIIGLLSKMAVDRSMESSISDAREAFVNVAADILSAYRLTQSSAPHGSLLAAHTLRLIPLYILALLKFVAFRIGQSTRLDDRVFAMCQLKSMPLAQLLQLVYPDLYPIHDLEKHPVKEVGPEKEKVHDPPRLQLSAERVDSHGVYLLDSGHTMIVYVGHNCPAALCQALFGAPSFTALPHESFDLPELDTAESDRLFAFIHHLCSEKAYVPCIQVIRDDSHHRMKFLEQLVEDKNEAGTSYYEFLQRIKQLGK